MSNKWVMTAVGIVACVALWNLLDYLVGTFALGGTYQFKVIGDLVLPAIVGAVIGYSTGKATTGKKS